MRLSYLVITVLLQCAVSAEILVYVNSLKMLSPQTENQEKLK